MKLLHILLLLVYLKISTNSEQKTQCRFKVALLSTPPYIMSGSLDPGFMYQTIKWSVDMACFSRQASDPTACNMDTIFVRSQGEMSNLMRTFPKVFLKPPGIFSEFCRVPSPKRAAYLSRCGTV